MSGKFLENLDWRFATKKFDASRPVSEDDLKKIVGAVHMAPSSFGLQPYHVFVVSNSEVKAKLQAAGYGQEQFVDASHILVFAARSDVKARVDFMVEAMTGGSSEAKEAMAGYIGMMNGFAEGMNSEVAMNWAAKQAYIALGFGLAAAAELGVDSCPMEGFSGEDFDKILGVEGPMKTVVVMAVGHRGEEPQYPKFRFPESDLFTNV